MAAPSQSEMEEGLMLYQPFVLFPPPNMATYNYTVHGTWKHIYSSPTLLESTSIVFAIHSNGIFHNRIKPSQGFDAMPSDFNAGLLILILMFMMVAIQVMKTMYEQKLLKSQWA